MCRNGSVSRECLYPNAATREGISEDPLNSGKKKILVLDERKEKEGKGEGGREEREH